MIKDHKPYELSTINGLRVVLYPIKGFPAIKANLSIYGGSSFENKSGWGAFHFIEHLCFESTKLFSKREEIELYKEENGLNNNATTGSSSIRFWTYGPKQSLRQALVLLNELSFNANLPETSFQKQIKIIDQEIKGRWDNPNFRFSREILKQVYGKDHIYTQDAGGQTEYLEKLTRADLFGTYERFFKTENGVLTVTGDFGIDEAKKMIKEIFLLDGGTRQALPKEKVLSGKKQILHFEDVEQNRVSLIWVGKGAKENDFRDDLALKIGRYILGGSTRSQLNNRLREALHLVYSTGFGKSLFPYAGVLEAWAATTTENTQEVVDEIRKTVYGFLETPIEKELFRRSINFIKSNIMLSFDSIHSISDSITEDLFWDDEIRLPEEIIEILNTISEVEVRDKLAEYVKPKNEYLAIMTRDKNLKVK